MLTPLEGLLSKNEYLDGVWRMLLSIVSLFNSLTPLVLLISWHWHSKQGPSLRWEMWRSVLTCSIW